MFFFFGWVRSIEQAEPMGLGRKRFWRASKKALSGGPAVGGLGTGAGNGGGWAVPPRRVF